MRDYLALGPLCSLSPAMCNVESWVIADDMFGDAKHEFEKEQYRQVVTVRQTDRLLR